MNAQILIDTAKAMVAEGKGLLAMDESTPTCNKRFERLGIPQTVEARRAYRELIVTTPGLGQSISGVILYDETIRQSTRDGVSFLKLIMAAGILPGIKVDAGAKALANWPNEEITEGLDGLRDRLAEYGQMGARFAKWRAVIAIGDDIPSRECIDANAHALARYAALCQEAGIVPIIEPEVLMDGSHSLERCREVTEDVLSVVFNHLRRQRIILEGMILKPNMVLPGLNCPKQESPDEVADATMRCLLRTVPAAVPGIAFLSGGQSAELASARLNAMNMRFKSRLPWAVTFSFRVQSNSPPSRSGPASSPTPPPPSRLCYIERNATALPVVANTVRRWKGLEHDGRFARASPAVSHSAWRHGLDRVGQTYRPHRYRTECQWRRTRSAVGCTA